jgi:hypothetical protein
MKKILNTLFALHKVPYRAKINFYTPLEALYQSLQKQEPVCIVIAVRLYGEGFGEDVHYPHFGVITHMDQETVTVQSPAHTIRHGENENGELVFSLSEFQEKFYAYPSIIKKFIFKPAPPKNIFQKMWYTYLNL